MSFLWLSFLSFLAYTQSHFNHFDKLSLPCNMLLLRDSGSDGSLLHHPIAERC